MVSQPDKLYPFINSIFPGIYIVLFSYNMYLQLRNFRDKGANGNKPNVLLLISSTLLFLMISTVRIDLVAFVIRKKTDENLALDPGCYQNLRGRYHARGEGTD